MQAAQQGTAAAQGAHDGKFAGTLVAAGIDGGKQHQQPCSQTKDKQQLNSADNLIEHGLQLQQGAVHIYLRDVGEGLQQLVVQTGLCSLCSLCRSLVRRVAVRGDIAHCHFIAQAGNWVHGKEINVHARPIDFAYRCNGAGALHAAHVKHHAVAQFQAQRLHDARLHADGVLVCGRVGVFFGICFGICACIAAAFAAVTTAATAPAPLL